MSVVTLTFIASNEEIVSGIPRYITIESSVPATIHFTLDGTIPTDNSPIYIDTFEMPDNENSITLSAFGIDADGYDGLILTQIFAPDTTSIDVTRNVGMEGLVVDRFVDLTDIPYGYDSDNDINAVTDLHDLESRTIKSEMGRLGLAEGTQVEVLIPDPIETPNPFDDNFVAFSTNEDAQFFNPYAKTIVIDNRLDNDIRIINRPWGSIRKTMSRNLWGMQEIGGTDETYISGGFVRTFYSSKHNTMVSYYFDQNELRTVKSIQSLPENIPSINDNFLYKAPPLVFKWIERGRHSIIPL
jgi:hypothetical protein